MYLCFFYLVIDGFLNTDTRYPRNVPQLQIDFSDEPLAMNHGYVKSYSFFIELRRGR
jgi:energy-converting hydrogenase Eha subunit F